MITNESLIHYPILSKFNELTHFCTTRFGGVSAGTYGSFNLSPYTGDVLENYTQNQHELALELGISVEQLLFPKQTHSDVVKVIDTSFFNLSTEGKQIFLTGVDALITKEPRVCIAVTTADCVPIMLYDSVHNVVAVVHAGWRGTCSRLVEKTLRAMRTHFGTNPIDVHASIGVSISAAVYRVGEELVAEFEKQQYDTELIFNRSNEELYLDLWVANKWLLEQNAVPTSQIEIAGICSFTQHERFFSARKLGLQSGRMLSGIMLR